MPSESACSPPWVGGAEATESMQRVVLARKLEGLHAAAFAWTLTCCDGRTQEAEDVLQTVYLEILEGKARWRGASSWKTWLFAVIRNTAAQQRRRRAWRAVLLDRWWSRPAPPGSDPETEADRSQRSRWIRRALGELTAKQRRVLELVFYHDLTVREAAEVLGMRLGTARTHYQRGKKTLRDRLSEETDHGP